MLADGHGLKETEEQKITPKFSVSVMERIESPLTEMERTMRKARFGRK